MNDKERIRSAINIIIEYSGIDGSHHKTWVIDQVLRILADDNYNQIIKDNCYGEDGLETYHWDCGIAP